MDPGEIGGYRIFGRWFSHGRPQARPVALTAGGADSYSAPAVALSRGGLAVVVWARRQPIGPVLLEGAFSRLGGPWRLFAVDSSLLDSPKRPQVAAISDNEFVVVWQGVARSGRGGLNAQLFHVGESTLVAGEAFAVGEGLEILNPGAAVAGGPQGFEVVWAGRRERGEPMLWGQHFDASGSAVGPESALGALGHPESAVALLLLESRGYAVAWVESTPEGRRIWLSSLNAVGESAGLASEVVAGWYPVFDGPLLASDDAGRILILWTSRSVGSEEIEVSGVLWDQLKNLPIAPPFSIGSDVRGNTIWPALAGGAGSFSVVWAGAPSLVGQTLTYRAAGSEPQDRLNLECVRRSLQQAALEADSAIGGRKSALLLLRPLTSRKGWIAELPGPTLEKAVRMEIPAAKSAACAGGLGDQDRARFDWLFGHLALRASPQPLAVAVYRGEGVATFHIAAQYRPSVEGYQSSIEFELILDLVAESTVERRGFIRFIGDQTATGSVAAGRATRNLEVEVLGAKPLGGQGRVCVGNVAETSKADFLCPTVREFSISTAIDARAARSGSVDSPSEPGPQ